MHRVWNHHRLPSCTYNEYQHMVEDLKFTPRVWNSEIDVNKVLKHFTWTLHIAITVCAARRMRDNKNHFLCGHTQATNQCFVPFVVFQNPLVDLLFTRTKSFSPIHVLKYQKNYYIVSSDQFRPVLINIPLTTSVIHQNFLVTPNEIQNLVRGCPTNIPFPVAVYSSFTYVKEHFTAKIQEGLISFNQTSSQDDILNLFVTNFHNTLKIGVLNNTQLTRNFNKKNLYSNPRLTEGKSINFTTPKINQDLLNQEHCVCEHPDTDRFCLPNKRSIKNLGKLFLKPILGSF